MVRSPLARLDDIDNTLTRLLALAKDRTPADLSDDWGFGQACHYALHTIGEAAKHLPANLRAKYPEVPWHDVMTLRDILSHEYFRIDQDVIWEVLTTHLRPLHKTIKRMIADADQPALPL